MCGVAIHYTVGAAHQKRRGLSRGGPPVAVVWRGGARAGRLRRMILRRALLAALATTFVGAVAPWASAQPMTVRALKTLSVEQLGTIDVTTVAKQPEQVWRTPAAIYVITSDDIRRSGATTIPDLLRLAPGVSVNQSDSNRWAVGVRGFADIFSKNLLVMIDGRSVYTPLVGGVHWAIQDVVLGDIDRIEVIRGAGGSIWGANAVNGVVNIITKGAGNTQGLRVTAATGTVEHARAAVRFGASVGERLDYRVYLKALRRGPQFHPDDAQFDDWRAAQAGFRADWRPGDRDTVSVSGDLYSTNTGERADVSSFTPASVRTIDGRIDLTGGNVIVNWARAFAGGGRGRLQAFLDRTDREGFTFGEARTTADVDFNATLAPMGRHTLSFGAGTRWSPSTVAQVVSTLNFVPNEHTYAQAGGFVHDDIAVMSNRLYLGAGAKIERNSYTGTELLPSATVLWTPSARQTLWGALTRSVRTPSRFERDLQFTVVLNPVGPTYLGINGNPEFKSETVRGAEFGYRRLVTDALYVDVAAFTNRYGGLAGFGMPVSSLEQMPVPHVLLAVPFENSVRATTRGIELTPDWKPAPSWQLRGSYSYLWIGADTEVPFSNSARDTYRGLSARHQVRVQSRVDLPGGFEVDQTYRFVDALPAHAVRAYHSLDARTGWHWSNAVELSVVGQNLLQPHHREFGAVPVEIRRAFYVAVAITP